MVQLCAKTAFLPTLEYNVIQVEIVNDQYLRQSIKSGTQDISSHK